jgi:hypothetical protein
MISGVTSIFANIEQSFFLWEHQDFLPWNSDEDVHNLGNASNPLSNWAYFAELPLALISPTDFM